jgi:hypothetical protein
VLQAAKTRGILGEHIADVRNRAGASVKAGALIASPKTSRR